MYQNLFVMLNLCSVRTEISAFPHCPRLYTLTTAFTKRTRGHFLGIFRAINILYLFLSVLFNDTISY